MTFCFLRSGKDPDVIHVQVTGLGHRDRFFA